MAEELRESAEDYLESILVLSGQKEFVRAADICHYFGYSRPTVSIVLKDFRSYAEAQARVNRAYADRENWNRMAILNTACSGKFSSDRTIEEYVSDIWHLEKVQVL